VEECSLYVLLFLLPFSKAAIEVIFGVLLVCWLAARIDPATRRRTIWAEPSQRPLLISAAVFLGVAALSIPFSTHPQLSIHAFFSKWLEYVCYALLVAELAVRPRVARRALAFLAAGAFMVVVEGLWQEWTGAGLFRGHPLRYFARMTGPYENPIDLSTYLMVVIPIVGVMAFAIRKRVIQAILWLLTALALGCLGRTGAVGPALGLGLGFAVLAVLAPKLRRLALVLLVGLVLTAGFFLGRGGEIMHNFSSDEIGKLDRQAMWQAALGMIRDRPVLGQGLNTFMANYLEYWVGGQKMPRYAHNCYLQMAAEAGLAGLSAFLALLGLLFSRMISGMRRMNGPDALVAAALIASLAAFALHAAVDTDFYALRQAALFWVLAGLGVGWAASLERGKAA